MLIVDVNVLIYAGRADFAEHARYVDWLEGELNSDRAFGVSDLVLSGFLRIVTNPRVFREPSSLDEAVGFVEALRSASNAVTVAPGPRHWSIFRQLCWEVGARGALIPDAYFAAMAIESDCEWITTDRDYARFPGLRWRHPLTA